MSLNISGLYKMMAGFVPAGLNPKVWLIRQEHTYGLPQTVPSIDDLIAFYPGKMVKGQRFYVVDYPSTGTITTYVLNTSPSILIDYATETSLITEENWRIYFDEVTQVSTTFDQVWNFAPDYQGGQPPHQLISPHYVTDVALAWESNWEAIKDPSKGHKWGRIRTSNNYTEYESPPLSGTYIRIYDDWSLPINQGNPYAPGDYIANMWKRQDIAEGPITDPVNLTVDKWYVVEDGIVTDEFPDTTEYERGRGSYFQALSTHTFTFDADAIAQQIPDVPSRTLPNGSPNNAPANWEEGIGDTTGSEQLWKIWAQMTKYSQLKTPWYLEKIIEDPEYVRYCNLADPFPETICPYTKSITDTGGDPDDALKTYDELLEEAGWSGAYDDLTHRFIATRKDAVGGVPGPDFTTWLVEEIEGESGVWMDIRFKLFDRTADYDSVIVAGKPTGRDPSSQGWSNLQLAETDTRRQYSSQAWKYSDGTLKSEWTNPQPFTGDDLYIDEIEMDDETFKFSPNDPNDPNKVNPEYIRAIATLRRGNRRLWEYPENGFSYAWYLIYNDVEIDPPTLIDNDTGKDIYWLPAHSVASGNDSSTVLIDNDATFLDDDLSVSDSITNLTDGSAATIVSIDSDIQITTTALTGGSADKWQLNDNYALAGSNRYRDGQVIVITPDGVDGKAYFKVIQTFNIPDGDDMIFTTIRDVRDLTDGLDAKKLEIHQDHNGPLLYNTGEAVFAPALVVLRVLQSNIPSPTFYWYVWTGSWTAISGSEDEYSIVANTLVIDPTKPVGTPIFTADASVEEIKYACSTHPTNPDSADYVSTFSDYQTIAKMGSASSGTGGVSPSLAILTNESITAVLMSDPDDAGYGEPIETLGVAGDLKTNLEVWKNGAKLVYNTDYTVGISPTSGDLYFGKAAHGNGKDAIVYVNTWDFPVSEIIVRSGICTITITIGGDVLLKEFAVASTLDAPGAIFADIDSNKGYVFDTGPDGRTAKTLNAVLYSITSGVQEILDPVNYYYRWTIAGTPGSWIQGGVGNNGEVKSLARADIFLESDVTVDISEESGGSPIIFSRTERFTDTLDGRTFRLYSSQVAKPSPPPSTQQPDQTVGVWGPVSTDALWASDGTEIPGTSSPVEYDWSEAYYLLGDDGMYGPSAGFMLPMYINAASDPGIGGSTDDLTTMEGNGWTYLTPSPEANKYLWRAHRAFQAYIADATTGELILVGGNPQPVTFTNGKPDTNPMPGSAWINAERLTMDDGVNGDFYETRQKINTSTTTAPDAATYDTWKTQRQPSGWVLPENLDEPGETEYIWEIIGKIDGEDDSMSGIWSYPKRITGRPGAPGGTGAVGTKGDTGDGYTYVRLVVSSDQTYTFENITNPDKYTLRAYNRAVIQLGENIAHGTQITINTTGLSLTDRVEFKAAPGNTYPTFIRINGTFIWLNSESIYLSKYELQFLTIIYRHTGSSNEWNTIGMENSFWRHDGVAYTMNAGNPPPGKNVNISEINGTFEIRRGSNGIVYYCGDFIATAHPSVAPLTGTYQIMSINNDYLHILNHKHWVPEYREFIGGGFEFKNTVGGFIMDGIWNQGTYLTFKEHGMFISPDSGFTL